MLHIMCCAHFVFPDVGCRVWQSLPFEPWLCLCQVLSLVLSETSLILRHVGRGERRPFFDAPLAPPPRGHFLASQGARPTREGEGKAST